MPYLEAANKDEPDNAAVSYNLGLCYSELGQIDEVIIRLKRAVQLDPEASAFVDWHGHRERPHRPWWSRSKKPALEIALKGQSGLQINDPAKQYTLKSLPVEFSGLQLLASI